MVATIPAETSRDALLGELTDVALKAAAHHGARGASVDLEVELGNALYGVVRRQWSTTGTDGERWEECLAKWTEAAYRVVLAHGFAGPFVELEMELWRGLRSVIRTHRFLADRSRGLGDSRRSLFQSSSPRWVSR